MSSENTFESLLDSLKAAATRQDLEVAKAHFFGKKGFLTQKMKALSALDGAARKEEGQRLNALKQTFQKALEAKRLALEEAVLQQQLLKEKKDVTLPAAPLEEVIGHRHPLSVALDEMIEIFKVMGFALKEGPEIEDDEHNFTALNIAPHHPARTSHDTFYVKDAPFLLRTHTSNVEIRTMRRESPPMRMISPGRVFRSDSDATHTPMFHQIEGLVIEKGVHMGHLTHCLKTFLKAYFGKDLPMRFRPSYFPFTEPSCEVDIQMPTVDGAAEREEPKWLEVLGCGMTHANVLRHMGLDPSEHQGFAFGLGVERLLMLKKGLSDIRAFYANDVRWLKHFGVFSLASQRAG
ncbi:MAG: phenylalanine--tRNA ligase subunit alpha [Holosporaceae bacterium]